METLSYLVWLKNESDIFLSDLSKGMLSNILQYSETHHVH